MGQVAVALGYYAGESWTMVDAELYLPESWFDKDLAKWSRQLHIPDQRSFLTKQQRTNQDAKSEAGWDELVARKYRAWIHHTALDALALWFVAQTKLDWRAAYPRDPALIEQLEVVVLPALSMANVRELLKAVLPLKQLSPSEATRLGMRIK
ncbi:MAG: hypothetical protein QNJ53_18780 [Pleurocapsa sp. MO_192.B19]|nr:hypothetical protein [Pleurocapsa sp. MO_192.B19]